MEPIRERELNSVVVQYLNVANIVLDENEDKTPYKQLIHAGQKLLDDKRVGMSVYKDDSDEPIAHFTLGMKGNRLEMLAHGKKDIDFGFKVKKSYLEDVVENSDTYIENPLRMDFNWLKSRVGLS